MSGCGPNGAIGRAADDIAATTEKQKFSDGCYEDFYKATLRRRRIRRPTVPETRWWILHGPRDPTTWQSTSGSLAETRVPSLDPER